MDYLHCGLQTMLATWTNAIRIWKFLKIRKPETFTIVGCLYRLLCGLACWYKNHLPVMLFTWQFDRKNWLKD